MKHNNEIIKLNETLEPLDDGLFVIQSIKGYHFTSDAVILSKFCNIKHNDTVIEFCAGSGIISILINHKYSPKKIFAFEVQEKVADMAKRSVQYNGYKDKIEVINDKLQNYKKYLKKQSADVIVCNPPYIKMHAGHKPLHSELAISKTEAEVTLEEIIICAGDLLRTKGRFFISMIPGRLTELIFKLKQFKLEPKKIYFAYPTLEHEPSCVFVEAVKDANEGVKILPPLITNNVFWH